MAQDLILTNLEAGQFGERQIYPAAVGIGADIAKNIRKL